MTPPKIGAVWFVLSIAMLGADQLATVVEVGNGNWKSAAQAVVPVQGGTPAFRTPATKTYDAPEPEAGLKIAGEPTIEYGCCPVGLSHVVPDVLVGRHQAFVCLTLLAVLSFWSRTS